MKILVINGPNLNQLAKRDPENYGVLDLVKIEELLKEEFSNDQFTFFQSNIEGEIVNIIQSASDNFDAILINPGGYAHTSVSIHDALEICPLPKIEVHLSHLAKREEFRQTLITAKACDGYLTGFKEKSYLAGVYLLKKMIK